MSSPASQEGPHSTGAERSRSWLPSRILQFDGPVNHDIATGDGGPRKVLRSTSVEDCGAFQGHAQGGGSSRSVCMRVCVYVRVCVYACVRACVCVGMRAYIAIREYKCCCVPALPEQRVCGSGCSKGSGLEAGHRQNQEDGTWVQVRTPHSTIDTSINTLLC